MALTPDQRERQAELAGTQLREQTRHSLGIGKKIAGWAA